MERKDISSLKIDKLSAIFKNIYRYYNNERFISLDSLLKGEFYTIYFIPIGRTNNERESF